MPEPETMTLQVRSFPTDAYEILRRLAFERRTTHADVIAELLRKAQYWEKPEEWKVER